MTGDDDVRGGGGASGKSRVRSDGVVGVRRIGCERCAHEFADLSGLDGELHPVEDHLGRSHSSPFGPTDSIIYEIGGGRMDLADAPEDAEFRAEIRAWL